MRLRIRLKVLGMLLGSVAWMAHSAMADEGDEIKAKAAAVRKEAQELARNGDYAGAQKRWEESKALMAAWHERQNPEGDAGRPRPEQAKRLEKIAQRVKHLRGAAEHLKAAEMHDLALDMTRRADDMESDLVRAKESLAREINERPEASMPQEPPPEVQKAFEARLHAFQQMQELQTNARKELIEALAQKREDTQQQITHALHEHLSETKRRLQEENEQLRNEMRELRTMVERIAKELKRQRDL